MVTRTNIATVILGALLSGALVACGGTSPGTPSASTEQSQTAQLVPAEDELGPFTYTMLTLDDDDAAALSKRYLEGGYATAPYQLMLYRDGGGLLYLGRTFQGVTYEADSLSIEGDEASLAFDEGQIHVNCKDGRSMTFDVHGTPTAARVTKPRTVGHYQELNASGKLLTDLELEADGTGTFKNANTRRTSTVWWGIDPVFGRDYLMLDGITHSYTITTDVKDSSQATLTISGTGSVMQRTTD